MAYALNGTNQWLSAGSCPVASYPFSLSANFKKTGTATKNGIFLRESSTIIAGFYFGSSSSIRGYIQSFQTADWSLGTYSTGQKGHVCITGTSATARAGYFNGSVTTSTTNVSGALNFGGIHIGALSGATTFDGDISEVAVWNEVLTQDEVSALSLGFAAYLVRPHALRFYAPLIRELIDVRGGLAITNNNTATVADHPRVYR